MLKAYKQRLYPTEKQKLHFMQAMGCIRYIYNKGLEAKTKHFQDTGKSLSCFDLMTGMLLDEKHKHEWLKAPSGQSLQMALRNLDNAFQRFFHKQTSYPSFKKKNNKQSLQYPQRVKVDFEVNQVWLPKINWVKCIFDRQFTGKIKTCTVSMVPSGKFFISILVETDEPLPPKHPIKPETTVGIDLGIKTFAAFSTRKKVANPKFFEAQQKRLAVLQKRAARKQKGSKNRKKAQLKVAKLYEKVANQRKNFLQQLSTKIIRENQTIILEDLNVAGMLKNSHLSRTISDAGWSEFVRMLTYKAEWNGNNLIQIGRFDPSSKKCNCCGTINQDLKLSDRQWICEKCGTDHDRDLNAAINIKVFGLVKARLAGQVLPEALAEIPGSKPDRRSKKSTVRKSA